MSTPYKFLNMTILQIRKSVLLALFLAISASSAYGQNPVALAYYDFESNSARSTTGENQVETSCSGTSASALAAGGTSSPSISSTYATGTGSSGKALSTSSWFKVTNGVDPTTTPSGYLSFTINASNFANIGITLDVKSSAVLNNHLNKYEVLYKKNSGSITQANFGMTGGSGGNQALTTNFAYQSWNFGTGADNASTLTIYIYAYGGTSLASADALIIDNLFIHATKITGGVTLADYSAISTSTGGSISTASKYNEINAFNMDATSSTVSLNSNLQLKPSSGTATTFQVANGTLDCSSYTISPATSVTCSTTIANGATIKTANSAGLFGASGCTFNSSSAFTTTLQSTSTVIYNNAASQTISPGTYGNLTISDRTTANSTVSFSSGIYTIADTFSPTVFSNGSVYSVNNSPGCTIQYSSTGAQTIAAFPYHDLIGSTATSGTISRTLDNTSDISIEGTFTATSGGTSTVNYTTTGSTVNFTGISNIPTFNFNNVKFQSTSTLDGDITINGGGTLTIDNGSSLDCGTHSISQSGVGTAFVNVNSGATLLTSNPDGHKGSSSGTIRTNNITISLDISSTPSTVEHNGTSAQTVKAETYGHLIVSGGDRGGATITFENAGDFYIYGNFDCSAASNVSYDATDAHFHYNGASGSTQNFSAAPTYDYVELYNSSIAVLDGDATINKELTLTGGKLQLGAHKCTITSGGAITGYDQSNYVVTDQALDNGTSTGSDNLLYMDNTAGNTIFPIGHGTYRPVTVNGSGGMCGVGVVDGATDGNTTPITWRAVSSTWAINSLTNASIDVTLQWNYEDQLFYLFDDNHVFMANRDALNVSWTQLHIPTVAASGSNPYAVTKTGVSVTPGSNKFFGIGDQYSALPVTLTNFKANKVNNHTAKLIWNTSSEINNSGFEVQRSTNGVIWEKINFTPGHATTQIPQNYELTDENMPNAPVVYYQLKQIDFNGASQLSGIRTVRNDAKSEALALIVAPNPAKDNIMLSAANAMPGNYAIRISDMNGKVVLNESINNDTKGFMHKLDVAALQSGQYIINVVNDNSVSNSIFVKQ